MVIVPKKYSIKGGHLKAARGGSVNSGEGGKIYPAHAMDMEDDLYEYSISGTETFISDHNIKYYCDETTYPTAYVWIKYTSTSSFVYRGFIDPTMLQVTEVINDDRLTSMTVDWDDIYQPE